MFAGCGGRLTSGEDTAGVGTVKEIVSTGKKEENMASFQ
jgi:hypothetical protein